MRLYITQHCHHQNHPCIIKMGSEESHFNVAAIVRGKVTKTASINHNFFAERGKLKQNRTEALLLTSLTPHRWAKRPASEVAVS